MNLPRPRRPTKRSETTWVWALAAGVLLTAAYYGVLAVLHRIQQSGSSAASTFLLIVMVGLAAVALLVITGFYTFKKRRRRLQEHMPGSMMAWLKSHVWLGLLAIAVAFLHAVIRPYTPGLTTGKLTLLVLLVLVASGILWRAVYALVPPRVGRDKELGFGLAVADTVRELEQVQVELDKLSAGRSEAFQRAVADLLTARRPQDLLDAEIGAMGGDDAAVWHEVKTLAGRRDRYMRREVGQRRYAALLQKWKFVHLPLAAVLFGLIVVHVLDVFGVVRFGQSSSTQGFVSAIQCGACHTQIADEWRRSMLAHSQLSPVDIAQMALALKKAPNFGGFCIDCHAPIGSQVVPGDTLPLAAGPDHAGVIDEGISCTACHMVHSVPPPGRGAFPDFPIEHATSTSDGTVEGPPLSDPPPLPVPDHNVSDRLMRDEIAASQLCGACHVVEKDLNGDGKIDAKNDLVLQTTFDEWTKYLGQVGARAGSCISCHMPPRTAGLVQFPPLGVNPPVRQVDSHTFVGVDYDLAPNAYSDGALQQVLADRAELLRKAATLKIATKVSGTRLTATVTLSNVGGGHDLPTGFAFVRQMWLAVSATTGSGKPACLAPDPHGIASPCASGVIPSAQADLLPCDPQQVALGDKNVVLTAPAPLDNCDPWLVNYQKILTDGDPGGTGTFHEVAYQSLMPGIVKIGIRVADQQQMTPIPAGKSARFKYVFDVSGLGGQRVTVDAALRFRHLPPYFIRELGPYYPKRVSVGQLLGGLVVVDMREATSESEAVFTSLRDSGWGSGSDPWGRRGAA